jgi:hypothetical protein
MFFMTMFYYVKSLKFNGTVVIKTFIVISIRAICFYMYGMCAETVFAIKFAVIIIYVLLAFISIGQESFS